MTVPNAYYQFIIDYAPYVYVIPPDTPDPAWGRAAFAAAFAIDFLYQAYYDSEFASKQTDIYNKIVSLADWILTQQNTDPAKKAYGGFKSNETSTYYYSVDAARVIPSLIKPRIQHENHRQTSERIHVLGRQTCRLQLRRKQASLGNSRLALTALPKLRGTHNPLHSNSAV